MLVTKKKIKNKNYEFFKKIFCSYNFVFIIVEQGGFVMKNTCKLRRLIQLIYRLLLH